MIEGFEEFTKPLTKDEQNIFLPLLVKELRKHIGKPCRISNREICRSFAYAGMPQVHAARVRKLINHIRINNLVPNLIANNMGYYIATSKEEVEKYAEGLGKRAEAILAMRDALLGEVSDKLFI